MSRAALQRHLVLHAVAVKKHGEAGEIAALAGLSTDSCQRWLDNLTETGRVVAADGRYVLAPLARVALDGDYSRFCADLRRDAGFLAAYEQFERINAQLKALITEWQTVEVGGVRIPNDHSDEAHDEAVIDRLGALHERAEPVFAGLEKASQRFACYSKALESALEKAEDGEIEWVSDARLPSYHTVWFELHEDLLRVLGRVREE